MAENMRFLTLTCPTCGGTLKARNETEMLECAHCGNMVVPVKETPSETQQERRGGAAGGDDVIKQSSTAIAYMEDLFADYDWDAFLFSPALTVQTLDNMLSFLRVSSADDKNTWIFAFRSAYEPYMKKVEGCDILLQRVIDQHREGSQSAYSLLDAYNSLVGRLRRSKSGLVSKLEKHLAKAEKFGAAADELAPLSAALESLKNLPAAVSYQNILDIPAVAAFVQEKNETIVRELAAQGIDAAQVYSQAQAAFRAGNYPQALSMLQSLKGYADTAERIEKLNRRFWISDYMELDGKLYFMQKNATLEGETATTYALYPTENGKIAKKPLINKMSKVVDNFADILYYLDEKNVLQGMRLSSGQTLTTDRHCTGKFYLYENRVFLVAYKKGGKELIELNKATGTTQPVLGDILDVLGLWDNRFVYTMHPPKPEKKKPADAQQDANAQEFPEAPVAPSTVLFNVLDLDTGSITFLGPSVQVQGFLGTDVIYTRQAPNANNLDLYRRTLQQGSPEILLERNIYSFFDIVGQRLFYYVGSSRNKTLIHTELDGSDRREWSRSIHSVLSIEGGWMYFMRKAAYTTVLCKSRTDGTLQRVIVDDIKEFLRLRNGYLYYLDDNNSLIRMRLDGTNAQTLCRNLRNIVSLRDDLVTFVAMDDAVHTNTFEGLTTHREIMSIYSIDFSGSGKRKLVYDVETAKEYDENTIYYITENKRSVISGEMQITQLLHALQVDSGNTRQLLDLTVEPPKPKKNWGCLISLGLFALGALLLGAGAAAGEGGMAAIGGLMALISLFAGVGTLGKKN